MSVEHETLPESPPLGSPIVEQVVDELEEPKVQYVPNCRSYYSGTSFLNNYFEGFSRNSKVVLTLFSKQKLELQAKCSFKSENMIPSYDITLKHKGPVAINLKANKKTVSANFKYPHDKLNMESTFGYTPKQKLANASYTLTKEVDQRQVSIKQILNVAGDSEHPKKKRNASLKFDFKNMKAVCGNIALVYDWTREENDFFSFQSSFCTNVMNPWFMGVTSTSKIYKPRTMSSLSTASTTNSAFVQYKSTKFVSAISCNPLRQEIETFHLQNLYKKTKLAVKLKYFHKKGKADVSTAIQQKINKRGDIVRVKASNDGNLGFVFLSSIKKTNLSFIVLGNYFENTVSWALSYKIKI